VFFLADRPQEQRDYDERCSTSRNGIDVADARSIFLRMRVTTTFDVPTFVWMHARGQATQASRMKSETFGTLPATVSRREPRGSLILTTA
jgi:hypothetical protein